jgi:DNA-binding XRE family transcriptional regulator
MADLEYKPEPHDHAAFLGKAMKREGFREAYDNLSEEYLLAREMLSARARSGLTQEAVAERMSTTKSAVSRLETGGRHAPSLRTLKKYAQAVGCRLEIRLVPGESPKGRARKRAV